MTFRKILYILKNVIVGYVVFDDSVLSDFYLKHYSLSFTEGIKRH